MEDTQIFCLVLAILAGLTELFLLISVVWLSLKSCHRWKQIDLSLLYMSMIVKDGINFGEYLCKTLKNYNNSNAILILVFEDISVILFSLMFYIILIRFVKAFAEILHFSDRKNLFFKMILNTFFIWEISSKMLVYILATRYEHFDKQFVCYFNVILSLIQVGLIVVILSWISYHYNLVHYRCLCQDEKILSIICFSLIIGNAIYIIYEILKLPNNPDNSIYVELVRGIECCLSNFLPYTMVNIWVIKQLFPANLPSEQILSILHQDNLQ